MLSFNCTTISEEHSQIHLGNSIDFRGVIAGVTLAHYVKRKWNMGHTSYFGYMHKWCNHPPYRLLPLNGYIIESQDCTEFTVC